MMTPMFVPLLVPPDDDPDGRALVIAVRGATVTVGDGDPPDTGVFLGTLAGRHCWAVDADEHRAAEDHEAADGFVDLHSLWSRVDDVTWTLAGRAVQLVEWTRTHRYCGRCAMPTEPAPGERARRCAACGLLAFPRLAPAVITLVERDDGAALLARNRNWPPGFYSCLAGFVEPGETIEDAVRREVREEVGVEVDDLAYRSSQPWPFPHSLMIGFSARWVRGDIVCDETEIAEAAWFRPDELPGVPPPMSIARRLIDDWLARHGG
jgi:NAD+ diphosphatase